MSDGLQLHPLFNALLNATSGVLMFMAYAAIKSGDRQRHKRLMLSAFAVSCAFLVSYLLRVYLHGSTPFPGTGAVKVVYLTILFSHMVLATVVPVGIVVAILWALKGRFSAHKRLVKVVFPGWAYVSVTGVVIYAMLYHWPR